MFRHISCSNPLVDVLVKLLRMLFPWIEEAKLDARFALDTCAQDYVLQNFLELLT